MREELSIVTRLLGELFVMMVGVQQRQQLYVLNWATQLKVPVNAALLHC